jgi:RimJ/RimL family protein N-acetyltransferase
MVEVLADVSVHRYLSHGPPTLDYLQGQYEYLTCGKSPDGKEDWLTWVLVPHGQTRPVGYLQATVVPPDVVYIAYVLGRQHWGRGYAREGVGAMLKTVFRHFEVARALAEIDTQNTASIALVEALGFRRIGTQPQPPESGRVAFREHVYELTRDELSRLAVDSGGGD